MSVIPPIISELKVRLVSVFKVHIKWAKLINIMGKFKRHD